MFKKTSAEDMGKIVTKFKKDFELCGYDWTLEILEEIMDVKNNKELG